MFTRRTATVTISAPERSTASRVVAKSRYLPVPTMSRERYERPASTNGSSSALGAAVVSIECGWVIQPPPTKCTISMRSPAARHRSPYASRGTTSSLISTAMRPAERRNDRSISATLHCASTSRDSPLTVTRTPKTLPGSAVHYNARDTPVILASVLADALESRCCGARVGSSCERDEARATEQRSIATQIGLTRPTLQGGRCTVIV